jgi:regulator of protease activity HflC (stomatin/prohibitin superfamily)
MVVIIEPTDKAVKVFLGKYVKVVGPGWYIIWPIIHRMIRRVVITQVVDLAPQTVTTQDGHGLVVSGAIRYHVVDARKAILNVEDLDKALSTLALGVILDYMHTRTLTDSFDIESVKKELRRALAKEAEDWGIKLEKVYLTDCGKVRSLRLFGDNMRTT